MGDGGNLALMLADTLAEQGELFRRLHEQLEGQRKAIRDVDIPALEACTLRIEELNAHIHSRDEKRRACLSQLERELGRESGSLTCASLPTLRNPRSGSV